MKLIVDRTYFNKESTVGFLKVVLSGKYKSQYLDSDYLLPYPAGGWWMTLCHTVESRSIPWKYDRLMGQKPGVYIPKETAIPEGLYSVEVKFNTDLHGLFTTLLNVPKFKTTLFKSGIFASQAQGNILIGNLQGVKEGHPADNPILNNSSFFLIYLRHLIDEANMHREETTVLVRSYKGWEF